MIMKSQRLLSLLTLLSTASLFLLQPMSTVGYHHSTTAATANDTDFIRSNCQTTQFPDLCYTSLSGYASAIQQDSARLARFALGVSLSGARQMARYVSKLSRLAHSGQDIGAAAALRDCTTVFGDAVDQIRGSLKQMLRVGRSGESFKLEMSNVQTWMSAALTNEETCTEGLEEVGDGSMNKDVGDRVVKVKEVTSNAIALVNSYAAKVNIP